MAKKQKISDKKDSCGVGGCDYSPCIYIDFDDLGEVSGVNVGDKLTVVIKGTVRSLEQRESDGPTKASISLKDFEAEVVSGQSQIEALFGDEDD